MSLAENTTIESSNYESFFILFIFAKIGPNNTREMSIGFGEATEIVADKLNFQLINLMKPVIATADMRNVLYFKEPSSAKIGCRHVLAIRPLFTEATSNKNGQRALYSLTTGTKLAISNHVMCQAVIARMELENKRLQQEKSTKEIINSSFHDISSEQNILSPSKPVNTDDSNNAVKLVPSAASHSQTSQSQYTTDITDSTIPGNTAISTSNVSTTASTISTTITHCSYAKTAATTSTTTTTTNATTTTTTTAATNDETHKSITTATTQKIPAAILPSSSKNIESHQSVLTTLSSLVMFAYSEVKSPRLSDMSLGIGYVVPKKCNSSGCGETNTAPSSSSNDGVNGSCSNNNSSNSSVCNNSNKSNDTSIGGENTTNTCDGWYELLYFMTPVASQSIGTTTDNTVSTGSDVADESKSSSIDCDGFDIVNNTFAGDSHTSDSCSITRNSYHTTNTHNNQSKHLKIEHKQDILVSNYVVEYVDQETFMHNDSILERNIDFLLVNSG